MNLLKTNTSCPRPIRAVNIQKPNARFNLSSAQLTHLIGCPDRYAAVVASEATHVTSPTRVDVGRLESVDVSAMTLSTVVVEAVSSGYFVQLRLLGRPLRLWRPYRLLQRQEDLSWSLPERRHPTTALVVGNGPPLTREAAMAEFRWPQAPAVHPLCSPLDGERRFVPGLRHDSCNIKMKFKGN